MEIKVIKKKRLLGFFVDQTGLRDLSNQVIIGRDLFDFSLGFHFIHRARVNQIFSDFTQCDDSRLVIFGWDQGIRTL